jgi:hypothetical protein
MTVLLAVRTPVFILQMINLCLLTKLSSILNLNRSNSHELTYLFRQ